MTPEYPALKKAADKASRGAQRLFVRLTVCQLSLLAVSAFISGFHLRSTTKLHVQAASVAGCMFLVLAVALALRIGRFDDRWFRSRAFAENMKRAVWQYIMAPDNSDSSAERQYLKEISYLKSRLNDLNEEFSRSGISGPDLTEWMTTTRTLALEKKIAIYSEHRLRDQIGWYESRARTNAVREQRWFWGTFIVEFVAVAYAILQCWQLWPFNAVSGIAALCAGFVAWSQTKRFSDLSTSYSVAANDLRSIEECYRHLADPSDVPAFVEQVENAVSREHRLWLARRIVSCGI